MELLKKFMKLGGRLRLYFQRSAFYMSMANFLMILSNFKLNYGIEISAFVLVPLGIIGVLVIGLIDYFLILPGEIQHRNRQNDLKDDVKRIEKKIDTYISSRE